MIAPGSYFEVCCRRGGQHAGMPAPACQRQQASVTGKLIGSHYAGMRNTTSYGGCTLDYGVLEAMDGQ